MYCMNECICIRTVFLYSDVFSPNTGKYGPEITPYLDTFYAESYSRLSNISQSAITCSKFTVRAGKCRLGYGNFCKNC